jgi:hypothetical protein
MRSSDRIFILVLVTLILCPVQSFGQKWGKVSEEEKSMTSMSEDPDADAVILFDMGEYFFKHVYPVTLARHTRVKVFSKRGIEYANISTPFLQGEKVTNIEGHTFSRDGKRVELKEDQIFTRKGENQYEIAFTLPGVDEGCVFEYRYQLWSDYTYILRPWYFQNDIFTKLSQIILKLQSGWVYSYSFMNPRGLSTEPRVEDSFVQRREQKDYIWTYHNIQPIREEPFVDCLKDYRTGVWFERTDPKKRGAAFKARIDTWREMGQRIDDRFDKFIEEKQISQKAAELTQAAVTDRGKARAIYDYVSRNIEWNGERGIFNFNKRYLETVLTRPLEELRGTAMEKNLLLWKLLRGDGLEAWPVLIGTRDHGRTIATMPGLFQFNHIITWAKIGGEDLFLDAADPSLPFGLLPTSDLVEYGLVVDGEQRGLIRIPPCKVRSRKHFAARAELGEDGGLICSTAVSYEGYPSVSVRKQLTEEAPEQLVEQGVLSLLPAATIDSVNCFPVDSLAQPLRMRIRFSTAHYAQAAGKTLYLNPTLFTRVESNPFKSEARDLPVEFPYPLTVREDVEFSIPAGFEIVELPSDVHQKMPGVSFSKMFSTVGNLITCHRRLEHTGTNFPVEQYQTVRNFYQEIVNADQLMVVLAKKEEP